MEKIARAPTKAFLFVFVAFISNCCSLTDSRNLVEPGISLCATVRWLQRGSLPRRSFCWRISESESALSASRSDSDSWTASNYDINGTRPMLYLVLI